ncbi:unnamed protein product [Colias eurytheme]|nr:unnamed protein product [Colias eurytheme]
MKRHDTRNHKYLVYIEEFDRTTGLPAASPLQQLLPMAGAHIVSEYAIVGRGLHETRDIFTEATPAPLFVYCSNL